MGQLKNKSRDDTVSGESNQQNGSAAGTIPVAPNSRGGSHFSHHLSFYGYLLRRRRLLWSSWVSIRDLQGFSFFFSFFSQFSRSPISFFICRVTQSANSSEIKKAYYKLSLKQYLSINFSLYITLILLIWCFYNWFIYFLFFYLNQSSR